MRLLLSCLAFLLALASTPVDAGECGTLATTSGNVGYCVSAGVSRDLLYVFHGAVDASVQAPEKQYAAGVPSLDKAWRKAGMPRPTTIALSWGPIWFLKDDKFAAFQNEIIPALEARFARRDGRRLLLGGSMGGFNAYLAWVQAPQLFHRVAFVCPAFLPVNPFASRLMFLRRAATRLDTVRAYSKVARAHFASAEEWQSYQPNAMMARLAGRKLPAAYLVHNRGDQLGFTGAPELGAAGQPITYEVNDGPHCHDVATPGLARFLAAPR